MRKPAIETYGRFLERHDVRMIPRFIERFGEEISDIVADEFEDTALWQFALDEEDEDED